MAIPSYTYFKLKMSGPCGVIIITGSFPNAYEYEMLAIEQAQRDLILDEPKHADKDKQEAGSGMPRQPPRSLEHRLMPKTLASVLPPDSMVFASPATPVPLEVPGLPEEAKPEEETNDPTIRKDPVTGPRAPMVH
jgi:hypothetical protein